MWITFKVIVGFLRRYWKPLAMLLLAMLIYLSGDHNGAERRDNHWLAKWSSEQARYAKAMNAASEAARKREQNMAADFAAESEKTQVKTNETLAHRDRIISGLRAGRLSFRAGCPAVPEAAADPVQSEGGEEGGQSGLVGEAITTRLAIADEVTHERNQCVALLRSERE